MTVQNKYKVSEFAKVLGITEKTVYRMIERNELVTSQERVNNRAITYILINSGELDNYMSKYNVNVSQNNVNDVDNEEVFQGKIVKEDLIDKIQSFMLEINKQNNDTVKDLIDNHNSTVKEYLDRTVTAETQHKLIETSERNKDDEINKLRAELKQAQSTIDIYAESAATAEQKQKLIEASEHNKDEEINRLNTELKQATSTIESLNTKIEELTNKKSWFSFKK
jgi:chromosome segregation ATPase